MSSLILSLSLLAAFVRPVVAQSLMSPPTRTVTLITIGPGDAIYEKFGHNLLWVHDPVAGTDDCYNWGIFDFKQPNFISNFVRGRMLYSMDGWPLEPAMEDYEATGRSVRFQRLKLTQEQIIDLIARCQANRLPQNRDYRYDYFRDNCSTRVRDMLDVVTQGQVGRVLAAHAPPKPATYRQHALRLMQDEFWISFGIDFALGPACDRVLDAWDEAFLPARLADGLAAMVERQWSPWRSTRPPEPQDWPDRTLPMAAAGIAGGVLIAWTGLARSRRPRIIAAALTGLWWLVAGIGGVFLAGVWLLTDHAAAYANQNLLHFSPLAILMWAIFIFKLFFRKKICDMTMLWGAILICLISVAGLLLKLTGVPGQDNLRMILLALPLNLGAATAVWAMTRQRVGKAMEETDVASAKQN